MRGARCDHNGLSGISVKRGGGIFTLPYNLSQLLKGWACILIALHHYSQYMIGQGLSTNVFYFLLSTQGGYSGVALFFLLSGYGLAESEAKRHLSVKDFVIKRFWNLYKPLLLANILTYLAILAYGWAAEPGFVPENPLAALGLRYRDDVLWFVKILLVCYLVFTLSSQIRTKGCRNLVLTASLLALCVAAVAGGALLRHWMSVPFFAVGVLVSEYKRETAVRIRSPWMWTATILLLAALCAYTRMTGDAMSIHIGCNILQTVLLLWLLSCLEIRVARNSFLGRISYPVYLVHNKILQAMLFLGCWIPVLPYLAAVLLCGWLLYLLNDALKVSFRCVRTH